MAERAGVSIHRGTRLDAEDILAMEPDVVVLATGGIVLATAFPGLEESNWALAGDVLEGSLLGEGSDTLVIGGGLVGLEEADFLSAKGKKVVLVEIAEEVGARLDPLPRAMLLKGLKEQGVEIHTNTEVTQLGPDHG